MGKYESKNYRVNLAIQSQDRSGLLRDISGLISQLNLSILAIQSHMHTENDSVTIELTLQVNNITLLEEIFKKIKQVQGVTEIVRR